MAISVALYLRNNPNAVFAKRVNDFAIPPIWYCSIEASEICAGTNVAILSKMSNPTSPVLSISNAISKITSALCPSGRNTMVGTAASSLKS